MWVEILFVVLLCIPSFQVAITDDETILYSPIYTNNTYLIDKNGSLLNEWSSNFLPGMSSYFLPNGDILRPKRTNLQQGGSGGIQEFTSNGDIVWDYTYYSFGNYTTHHDIEPLPNGNVLSLS